MKYYVCTASMNDKIFKKNEIYGVVVENGKEFIFDEQGNKRASPKDFKYVGFTFRIGYITNVSNIVLF